MKTMCSFHNLLIFLSILPFLSCTGIAEKKVDATGNVQLQARTISLSKGVEPVLAEILERKRSENVHAIVQFKKKPTFQEHRELSKQGIMLQRYIGGNAYMIAIPPAIELKEHFIKKKLQWAGRIRPRDKLSRALLKKDYDEWALDKQSGKVKVLIQKFPDVDDESIQRELQSMGMKVTKYGSTTFMSVVSERDIERLSTIEAIKHIQQGPMPPQMLNERGRRIANTDQAQWAELENLQPGFRGRSGTGVQIGICDTGIDQAHDDFDTVTAAGAAGVSRVYNQRHGSGGHGTHVASIAGGNGINSENNGWPAFSLRGHAPECDLGDYPSFGSNADLYHDAIVNDGTDVSNHSYVQSYTIYDAEAEDLDSIIRGDASDTNGSPIPAAPQVWAAGNNGFSTQYGNEEGYYAVFTSSKNSISVGGLDTLDGRLYQDTSLGPTFDGRIKPDVVAPACMDSIGGSGIQAARSGTQGYTSKCGTSMAAPVVSGTIGLMMNAYEDEFGIFPSLYPSTYKAILVQTAIDQIKTEKFANREFNNPDTGQEVLYHAGPDFATGYGLVDATAATVKIADQSLWRQATINSTGIAQTWCVMVPEGAREFKVTLAWDDAPGDTTTAEMNAKIVNDLDLELIAPDGSGVLPWTLDPLPLTANPGDGAIDPIAPQDVAPAYRGADHRNNVEMANVFLPTQGLWKVKITGFNLPLGQSQPYSIVSSHSFLSYCLLPPGSICEVIPELCPRFDFCDRYPWLCEGPVREFEIVIHDDVWVVDPTQPQPIDEICKYVLDCPGCRGSSWEYCPDWDMVLGGLPEDVTVQIINDYGKLVFEDASRDSYRKLTIRKSLPGERFYVLFIDAQGKPYKETMHLKIK